MPIKESAMFLPAIAEKMKKEKQATTENRLELPLYQDYYNQYKQKEDKKDSVIHIQII